MWQFFLLGLNDGWRWLQALRRLSWFHLCSGLKNARRGSYRLLGDGVVATPGLSLHHLEVQPPPLVPRPRPLEKGSLELLGVEARLAPPPQAT